MPARYSARYTSVAIALHWIIAFLIIGMIWLGWNMETEDGKPIEWLYQLHKSVGISILILTVARILWRVKNPEPDLPSDIKPPERFLAAGTQFTFYVLMLAMPLTGWLLVSTSSTGIATVLFGQVGWPHIPYARALLGGVGHDVMEFIHSKLAWVLIVLLVLHVIGALKHEFSGQEGVLKRMWPGLFGKTSPPQAPPRGFLFAFGGAVLLFGLIAGAPLLAYAMGDKSPAAAEAVEAENWQADKDKSVITFSGLYEGERFSGTFEDWDASIAFDPDNLEASKTQVTINTASARTGTKLYDDTLKAAEWFDVRSFPSATVDLGEFTAVGENYVAVAQIAIKTSRVDVPLKFSLQINDNQAIVNGNAVLSRSALGLGQVSDAAGDHISDEITVTVNLVATRG